jgi:hypothetical protein
MKYLRQHCLDQVPSNRIHGSSQPTSVSSGYDKSSLFDLPVNRRDVIFL